MTRIESNVDSQRGPVPRRRGDDPAVRLSKEEREARSPQARG
ncbi:hypothetical protein SAMN05444515_101345 [Ectothiorhodospira marina]|uniref:Uncharacterized protein n=1 Tax=Ectothiorhodospira marina TaxID=1396821 RepID=A0A1H7G207_9GAMM|nr:hypothetical protein SAMN05444515_101345 [Ectothiorhodospira marina]